MFTGLVQDVGAVERLEAGAVTDLWIRSAFEPDGFVLGESIACDGVCLTVVEHRARSFRVQAAPETLRRTTVGRWAPGTRVNLERALRAGDRLGGHWVQGHVDGIAELLEARPDGGARAMTFTLPAPLAPYFIEKGSVCIDGVSLTLTAVEPGRFSVMLIPETVARTALGAKPVGSAVNLEADLVGKYIVRWLELRGGGATAPAGAGGGVSEAGLLAAGFGG